MCNYSLNHGYRIPACGHYIVLTGVETINGYNYFNVLDPHRDNPNYIYDGSLIDYVPNDGHVKARTSIFAYQADEYWVFSKPNGTTFA